MTAAVLPLRTSPPAPPMLELVKPCARCKCAAAFKVTHLSTATGDLAEHVARSCHAHLAPITDEALTDPHAVTDAVVTRYQR